MPARRILFLDPLQLSVYTWRKGEVALEQRFAADADGHAAFRSYLDTVPGSLFHLLADLPDESFQHDALPYVSGSDRQAMLKRKLGQFFFGTPFSLAQSLGRNKDGRRDERFMFAALTRPQLLQPWLEALDSANAILTGIYSPPLILPTLLSRAKVVAERLILITLTSGGLRQSYFENGQLRLSRLTPLASGSIEEAAISTYGEAAKIHQYLVGQRLLTRGQRITVLCLASPAQFSILQQSCIDTDELGFELHDIHQAADACNLRTPLRDSDANLLLAHLLAQKPPAAQFADPPTRLHYRRWQTKAALQLLALLLLGGSVLHAARTAFSIHRDRERVVEAGQALQAAQQQYQVMLQSLPSITLSPDALRRLIESWHQLQTASPSLASSLQPLSDALQKTPQIELLGLDWHVDRAQDENRPENMLIIDIDGQLAATLGPDHRAQSEVLDRFVTHLGTTPGSQARILSKPFDTDSSKSLKTGNESRGMTETLNFKVRYTRKLAP